MPWICILPFVVYSLILGGIYAFREDKKGRTMLKPWLIGFGVIALLEGAALLYFVKVYVPGQDYVDVMNYQQARSAFPDFPYPDLSESEEQSAQVYVTKNKLSGQPCESICLVYSNQEGKRFSITRGYGKRALSDWTEEKTVSLNGENIRFRWEEKGTSQDWNGLYYHCTVRHFSEGNWYELNSITFAKKDPTPDHAAYVAALLQLLP